MTAYDIAIYRFSKHMQDEARLLPLLSEDELARVKRLKFADARTRFVVGRGLLRQHLGKLLDMDPAEVRFHYGEHGKPALNHPTDLRFNLAHSHDLLLIATTDGREIGVDVEQIRPAPQMRPLAGFYFTPAERDSLEICAPEECERLFFHYWTAKEAYVKATGGGFRSGLFAQIEVPAALPTGDDVMTYHLRQVNGAQLAAWGMRSFYLEMDYIVAVCVAADS